MTLYDLYKEYVVDLQPILWEAGRINGVHVNNEDRLKLVTKLTDIIKGIKADAQPYVPEVLLPVKHYKKVPKKGFTRPVREVVIPSDKIKTCSRCGTQHVTKGTHTGKKGGKKGVPENLCYKADIILTSGTVTEYDVLQEFNPGSDDQMKDYAKHFHHALPRNWKTESETLDARTLQKFIDKYPNHPLYKSAREIRGVRKARSYAKAWVPDEQGKIYGVYKNVPETMRLSQAEHNLTNVSHRGNVPYAEDLRRLLVAPPGFMLVEADSSSVEAVFTGKIMGSESYMKMAQMGIHAHWAATTLQMEPTKANIKLVKNAADNEAYWLERAKPVKEVELLYEQKKRTVHGVSYGMGAKLLHELYPEFFPTVKLAQKEIDAFYQFVPDLKEWHLETQKWAHKHGYLENAWGFRNYYYAVFKFDWKTKTWRPGPDAKAAIAFKPQSSNAFFQRENIKLIDAAIRKMGKRGIWVMTAIGHIHDSNGLRVPEDDTMEAAQMMAEIMNRPIPQFGGLRVGVGVKAGHNWQDVKAILNV